MKVSGFSFIRDGVRFGYPFVESICSVLPICDEFVIAVGECADGTLEKLQSISSPKLRILQTRWNENVRAHGFVYGQQKMIAQYNCTGDWALYLEGDELFHEDDVAHLRSIMQDTLNDEEVEALAFDFNHFWGEPGLVRNTPGMYRKAARAIKNNLRTIAPDGLYWAVVKNTNLIGRRNKRRTRYPRALDTGIPVYHYGNTRDERFLAPRADVVNQYWGKEYWFKTYGNVEPSTVMPYLGSHPAIIGPWLEKQANQQLKLNPDFKPGLRGRKHRYLARLEKMFGWDLSKRHFKLLKNRNPPPGRSEQSSRSAVFTK